MRSIGANSRSRFFDSPRCDGRPSHDSYRRDTLRLPMSELKLEGVYNTLLLSFTSLASTYTSFPICRNFSDISAIPASFSFKVAA